MNERLNLKNKLCKVKSYSDEKGPKNLYGAKIFVEGWWDEIMGKSWTECHGNPVCVHYILRRAACNHEIPSDDEVVYGKINGLGYLVHISELELENV